MRVQRGAKPPVVVTTGVPNTPTTDGGNGGRRVRALKDRSGSLGSSIIASKGGGNSVLRRPGRGECVASLRVILYDLKLPSEYGGAKARGEGSTCDTDLQYGCLLAVGNKAILPSNVFVPLSTQPTCLGSHINFPVQTLESKLRVTVVDTETDHALGAISIPLKDIPFVHESMAFGLANYYEFKAKSKDGFASVPGGKLRIGLKLLKQRHPTRKLGEWRGKSAGGSLNHHTWVDNPQYWLSVSVRSIISVNLQSTLGKENQIGFYIIKIAELSELVRKRKAQEEDVVKSGDYFSWMERGSESVSKEVYILPGSYIIVPCVKYPGVEGVFQLTIVGDYDAGLKIDSFDEDQLEGEVEWLSSDDESSDVSSGSESAAGKEGGAKRLTIVKSEKRKQKEEKRRQLQQALLMKYGSMGNVNRLKLTLEKTRDVNAEGISALTFAARNGHFDCVSLLVGKGADINKNDTEGFNALLMAATGGHVDVLRFLLSHKEADILARDPVGNSALPLACASGSLECVELLLEKGSLVNQTNDQRQTPLMRAAAGGHADIVLRLIKKGAKVNSKDTSGQTALHYACTGGSLECVKHLLDHGADIGEKDRSGETALFKASFRGHVDILRLLIERGEKESKQHQHGNGLRASSAHLISQKSRLRDWDTITLLLEPNDGSEHEERERQLRAQARDRRDMKSSGSGSEAGAAATTTTTTSTSLSAIEESPSGHGHGKKRHVLDVLIVLMKHGKRRSAFQLISANGSVKSSNLVLEREEDESGAGGDHGAGNGGEDEGGAGGGGGGTHYNEALSNSSPMPTKANILEKDKKKDKKGKKSKKDKEDKKKEKEKEKEKHKKDHKGQPAALETDPLVEVIAKGQLEILCLLIEKGDMGNYLQNMSVSTLLYDLVDQRTFECLLAQFEGVFATAQQDERSKKRVKRRSRSLSPRKDGGADEVRQLSLAMLSPLTGPFGCALAAVDGVRLTVVNCIDSADPSKLDAADSKKAATVPPSPRTPRGTPIAMQSSMRRFIKAGHMDLLGVLFNTRRALLCSSHSIQTTSARKKRASANRQLFVWIREATSLAGEPSSHHHHHHHHAKSNGETAEGAEKGEKEQQGDAGSGEGQQPVAALLSSYCEVRWGKSTQRTGVRKHEGQPRWFERFRFDLGDPLTDQRLEVSVYDASKQDKSLGRLEISLADIMREAERGKIGPKWFELHDKEGNKTGGNVCMQLNVQLLASTPK